MTDCRLDLIPDKARTVAVGDDGTEVMEFRWVYENMKRIQEWAKCIEGNLDAIDGGSP